MARKSVALSSPSLRFKLPSASLSMGWARAWSWYRREIEALAPPRALAWLLDRGDRQLVFRPGDNRFYFRDPSSVEEPISLGELDEALARRGLTRDAVSIALEIEAEAFLVRRFDVPRIALAELPKLLAAHIERKTPFRLSDIIFGHVWSPYPNSPDKARVELWILRRDIASKALEGSALGWDEISVVRPRSNDSEAAHCPTIELRRGPKEVDWRRYVVIGSIGLTLLLLLAGAAATFWRQDRLDSELEIRIAESSARAARVRQIADRANGESRLLATLRQERASWPSFADLWGEASWLLPDTAYATELRVTEGKAGERSLELTGFAESAVGLPALFDQSSMFFEAALTAPITPDAQEKREAFSLRARIRPKGPAK